LNLLLVLIRSPYFMSNRVTGTKPKAMNPRTELPHPKPILAYSGGPASGKTVAMMLRRTTNAAIAEAAWMPNESTKYVVQGIVVTIRANDTKAVPRIGTTNWTCLSAVHPYKNRPIGIVRPPRSIGGKRYSGFISPPAAAALILAILSRVALQKKTPVAIPIASNC